MNDLDPFARLRRLTRARVGLGRAGDGLPTSAVLEFQMAHALARDAVHGRVEFDGIAAALAPRPSVRVASAAPDRPTYLRRPDLGRRLSDDHFAILPQGPYDVVFVIADGLSADAVQGFAAATLAATEARLRGLSVGPVVLASQARVALGDDIGSAMRARVVVILIGERPGLSSFDSLGAYLTFAPTRGKRDRDRNCISNIHAHGLSPAAAADKLAWLINESLTLGLSGVDLKEAAPSASIAGSDIPALDLRTTWATPIIDNNGEWQ